MSGRNWGDAVVDKSSLVFRVDKKTAFNIAIPDVSQVWWSLLSAQQDNQHSFGWHTRSAWGSARR